MSRGYVAIDTVVDPTETDVASFACCHCDDSVELRVEVAASASILSNSCCRSAARRQTQREDC